MQGKIIKGIAGFYYVHACLLYTSGEGLLARAICHELDHLDGVMYVDLVEGDLYEVGAADDEDEE